MVEKIYTINLKKATIKTPRWEKAKKSMSFIREFLKRHMKADEIRIGKSITEKVWMYGGKKIPNKIRIKALETEEGKKEEKKKVIKAELLEEIIPEEFTEEKAEEKEEKPKEESEKEETPK